MRYKSPSDCGLSKEHNYLGHFKQSKYIDQGHNSEPIKKSIFEQTPTVTKIFENDDPKLVPGGNYQEESKAKQARDEKLDALKRTKMIEGGIRDKKEY